MTSKKDLIIAVVITFCLTATLFTIVPAKSGNGSSYDPWKDLNDDGVVDSTDLGMLGTSWATTGDPTKNVNVTNWPIELLGPTTKKQNIVVKLLEWNDKGFLLTRNYGDFENAFSFNPRSDNINITRLVVAATVAQNETGATYCLPFEFGIGNGLTSVDFYSWGQQYYYTVRKRPLFNNIVFIDEIDYSALRLYVQPGINEFFIRNPTTYQDIWLYQLTIIIEFEYVS